MYFCEEHEQHKRPLSWWGQKLIAAFLLTISVLTHFYFTHWGRVTHTCVSELTIIGSDNGLSPGRRQAIFWNNTGLLLIQPLGTNVSEISIGIQTFSFKKMHLNMSSAKWRQFCLGLNVLNCADVSGLDTGLVPYTRISITRTSYDCRRPLANMCSRSILRYLRNQPLLLKYIDLLISL